MLITNKETNSSFILYMIEESNVKGDIELLYQVESMNELYKRSKGVVISNDIHLVNKLQNSKQSSLIDCYYSSDIFLSDIVKCITRDMSTISEMNRVYINLIYDNNEMSIVSGNVGEVAQRMSKVIDIFKGL